MEAISKCNAVQIERQHEKLEVACQDTQCITHNYSTLYTNRAMLRIQYLRVLLCTAASWDALISVQRVPVNPRCWNVTAFSFASGGHDNGWRRYCRSSASFQCKVISSLCLDSPVAGPLPRRWPALKSCIALSLSTNRPAGMRSPANALLRKLHDRMSSPTY
jgi:hypothetical protein